MNNIFAEFVTPRLSHKRACKTLTSAFQLLSHPHLDPGLIELTFAHLPGK